VHRKRQTLPFGKRSRKEKKEKKLSKQEEKKFLRH